MSTADAHCRVCSVCVHTDVSVDVTEQYLNEEGHCTVKELAEHTGIFGSAML